MLSETDTSTARNSCTRCHQRLIPANETAIIPLKGLRIRLGEIELRCRCGTWNVLPQRLRLRLCVVLKLS